MSYITHDKTRNNPVYFQWQIHDWDPPKVILDQCIANKKSEMKNIKNSPQPKKIIRSINFSKMNERNAEIGTLGEAIVLHYEKEVLMRANKKELAGKVALTKNFLGNTAAYDIHSYTEDGKDKYIEVKTMTGDCSVPFYLSMRERSFAMQHNNNYYLYRIYNLDRETNTGDLSVYQDIETIFEFEANNFSVKLKTPASS